MKSIQFHHVLNVTSSCITNNKSDVHSPGTTRLPIPKFYQRLLSPGPLIARNTQSTQLSPNRRNPSRPQQLCPQEKGTPAKNSDLQPRGIAVARFDQSTRVLVYLPLTVSSSPSNNMDL
ncbi:uncharacterized protein LOC143185121 [Calliopsis andreniformis]|uniref:uncharacterized protein LOC143185121 n=1 Tax=Calliopsis andreniformis TaxID=337506 RepID=UPI003FCC9A7C